MIQLLSTRNHSMDPQRHYAGTTRQNAKPAARRYLRYAAVHASTFSVYGGIGSSGGSRNLERGFKVVDACY